jgi:hypothetical protein
MELEFLKWAVITLLGVATYFLKRTVDQMDERLKEHKTLHLGLQLDVQNIKSEYLHKNDFRDFKIELRSMFDELKADIKSLRPHG